MLARLADSQEAMEKARRDLAAGQGEQALVHTFRASQRHAAYQRTAAELERLGLDASTCFETGIAAMRRHLSTLTGAPPVILKPLTRLLSRARSRPGASPH